MFVSSLGVGDSLARPVSRVLVQSRKTVEYRAFTNVGVSGKCYDFVNRRAFTMVSLFSRTPAPVD